LYEILLRTPEMSCLGTAPRLTVWWRCAVCGVRTFWLTSERWLCLCVRAVKAYYGDTLVGASSSRVEPISDDEDEDDESEERPGEGEVQKHVKMANYYVMTLGVLGPYRRFHSSSKRISDRN
jgi:hypothetical protein